MRMKSFRDQFRECKQNKISKNIWVKGIRKIDESIKKFNRFNIEEFKIEIILCTKYDEQCKGSVCGLERGNIEKN